MNTEDTRILDDDPRWSRKDTGAVSKVAYAAGGFIIGVGMSIGAEAIKSYKQKRDSSATETLYGPETPEPVRGPITSTPDDTAEEAVEGEPVEDAPAAGESDERVIDVPAHPKGGIAVIPENNCDCCAPVASVSDSLCFADAFAEAREQVGPGGVFLWHGKLYGTFTHNEWRCMSGAEKREYYNSIDEDLYKSTYKPHAHNRGHSHPHHNPDNICDCENVHDVAPVASIADGSNFDHAFECARAQVGAGGVFEWRGKLYGTYYADEWDSMSAAEKRAFGESIDHERFNGELRAHHDSCDCEPMGSDGAVREGTAAAGENREMPPVADVSDSESFAQAFQSAREEVGAGGVFEWRGKIYGTYYRSEWDGLSAREKHELLDNIYIDGYKHKLQSPCYNNRCDLTEDEAGGYADVTALDADVTAQSVNNYNDDIEVTVLQSENTNINDDTMTVTVLDAGGDYSYLIDIHELPVVDTYMSVDITPSTT